MPFMSDLQSLTEDQRVKITELQREIGDLQEKIGEIIAYGQHVRFKELTLPRIKWLAAPHDISDKEYFRAFMEMVGEVREGKFSILHDYGL